MAVPRDLLHGHAQGWGQLGGSHGRSWEALDEDGHMESPQTGHRVQNRQRMASCPHCHRPRSLRAGQAAGCGCLIHVPKPRRCPTAVPTPCPHAVPLPGRGSYLLLALLLQVELDLEGLARFEEGFAVLAVGHVVGHGAHRDGTKVDGNVGQDLWGQRKGERG